MLNGRTVAVVIPAYRVERQIGGVLQRMPRFVDHVFVVDDASPDGTVSVESTVPSLTRTENG